MMIHRVVFGGIERFIGILTEALCRRVPAVAPPVQAKVLTITSRADEAANAAVQQLRRQASASKRTCATRRSATKIRQSQMEKVPYMLVIGDKKGPESGTVSVESAARARAARCPLRTSSNRYNRNCGKSDL